LIVCYFLGEYQPRCLSAVAVSLRGHTKLDLPAAFSLIHSFICDPQLPSPETYVFDRCRHPFINQRFVQTCSKLPIHSTISTRPTASPLLPSDNRLQPFVPFALHQLAAGQRLGQRHVIYNASYQTYAVLFRPVRR